MPTNAVTTLVLVVVAVALIAVLIRFMSRDKIEAIIKKRKPTSLHVCSAQFVEGPTHIDVALAIDKTRLYYENADMQSYLDLKLLEEVEYDDSLLTGGAHVSGKVLRLRSHGHTFEFVLTESDIKHCQKVLPAHRADEPGEVHVEPLGAAGS
jgi:hypothetical protein